MTDLVVSRRAVLAGAGVAVVGAVVGFALARNSGAANAGSSAAGANAYGYTPPKSGGPRRLAAVDAIPLGGGVVVGGKVVLTRDSSGVHAFSAVCTHQGCTVGGVRNGAIVCPCHGSRFDAATGHVVRGPATRPLPAVPITITGGVVYAG